MADELRSRMTQILMDKCASERYPSTSMMDRVEAALGDWQSAQDYVNLLLDAVERDAFPSPTLVDRISGLIDKMDRARG